MEVIKEKVISTSEAKQILNEIKGKGNVYEQKICIEYLEKIPHLNKIRTGKIKEELSQIKELKPRQISSIISILPDTIDEVNMLFDKEQMKKDEKEKIVEIVKKYKSSKIEKK
ncbi:MAG: hypothetical protein J7J38_03820 [Candidatus Aenigmarchaeota archaeon]|nr:hypothetical protein [Candidatus Aenigmarchaeota archaeon]